MYNVAILIIKVNAKDKDYSKILKISLKTQESGNSEGYNKGRLNQSYS